MTLKKYYFSHPSFSYLLFRNPTYKTETETANTWGWELLIANHLDQSLWWMGQSDTLISSQITFITLFSAGAHNCCAFYESHCKLLYNYAEPKPFCWAKLAHFWPFLHPIFYSAGSHTEHRWRCSKGIYPMQSTTRNYFFSFLSCDTQLGIYRVSWKIEGSVQGVSY